MPVFQKNMLSPFQSIIIWEITESNEDLLSMLDASKELLIEYENIKNENRKSQWLAVRLMLKNLFQNNLIVKHDKYGKPFIENYDVKISITHSHKMIGIITNSMSETGIDIELISQKATAVSHKFMHDKELGSLSSMDLPESLYVYWGAKESLYKFHGKKELSFKNDIFIEPFEYNYQEARGQIVGLIKGYKNSFLLEYQKLNNKYMLVYILEQVNKRN